MYQCTINKSNIICYYLIVLHNQMENVAPLDHPSSQSRENMQLTQKQTWAEFPETINTPRTRGAMALHLDCLLRGWVIGSMYFKLCNKYLLINRSF